MNALRFALSKATLNLQCLSILIKAMAETFTFSEQSGMTECSGFGYGLPIIPGIPIPPMPIPPIPNIPLSLYLINLFLI